MTKEFHIWVLKRSAIEDSKNKPMNSRQPNQPEKQGAPPSPQKAGGPFQSGWASREAIRRALERTKIPGRQYALPEQRRALLGDIFKDPAKTHISIAEYDRVLRDLEQSKYRVKSWQERQDIEKKIAALKQMKGI